MKRKKKQKRHFDCSKQRLCYSFLFTEVFEKGWRLSHVHVRATDFVSRQRSAESHSRSASKLNESKLFLLESNDAVRSFFGGFSSTAGYVPGNEARCVSPEGAAYRAALHSPGRSSPVERPPFLSGRPPAGMPAHRRQAFRLQLRAYWTAAFRSFCPRTVRHRFRPSSRCRSRSP